MRIDTFARTMGETVADGRGAVSLPGSDSCPMENACAIKTARQQIAEVIARAENRQ